MTLGVRGVVDKQREIYLHKNVRIHLDRVSGLGAFLEFEAVLGGEYDEAASAKFVQELRARFAIDDSDLVDVSYGDLLASEGRAASR
jgi:predicted adenylyl cyclase CyaB